MQKRVATFGDVHGSLKELKLLYSMLEWESLDEIRHSGDLVDRGIDSHGVVQFCIEKNIQGVMGNHEESILSHYNRISKGGHLPKNPDKLQTLKQLTPDDIFHLQQLPYIHVDDAIQTVFVHAGVWPSLDWHRQPNNVCRAQLIDPNKPGLSRWFNVDPYGITEEEHKRNGLSRWYELYDHEYNVVFGHTVWQDGPLVYRNNESTGLCIGVDSGCNWSGVLTAVILPDLKFLSTPKIREFTFKH